MSDLESVPFDELCKAANKFPTEEDEEYIDKCAKEIDNFLSDLHAKIPQDVTNFQPPHRETLMVLHLFHNTNVVHEIIGMYMNSLAMRGIL